MRYLLLVIAMLAGLTRADEAALQSVQSQLSRIDSLQGGFQQQLISVDGEELEQSSGSFRLLQPGFFAWHIVTPDEQVLLASKGDLWHYDVELETATRRDIPPDSPFSPLTILSGDSGQLQQHYLVEALATDTWRLLPRFASADFSSIQLRLEAGLPAAMEIRDLLERSTLIRFSDLELNPPLEAKDFMFEPPPGVDVYDHE